MRRLKPLFQRRTNPERGAALIESAMVLPLLLVLAIGLAETGFALIDWLAVSNASREGARVGASAGSYDEGGVTADDLMLEAIGQASCAIENGDLVTARIYQSDTSGNMINNHENIYTLDALDCSGGTSSWTTNTLTWPSGSRNDKVGNLDIVGVEVTFDHNSLTGFFPMFDATWTDKAIMRIEPDTRG